MKMKLDEIAGPVFEGVEERVGIERAFDVLRNHTIHTKGYVMTALKFIEEFGSTADKTRLGDLLKEKDKQLSLATSKPPVKKPKSGKTR